MSLAVHAVIFGVVRPAALAGARPASALEPAVDRWAGATAELPFAGGAAAVYDVAVDAPPPVSPASAVVAPPVADAAHHVPSPVAALAPRPRRKPRPAPSAEPSAAGGAAPGGAASTTGGGSAGGPFGAAGAAAVRDLGRAFTRAIPPACDADPIWATLPAGDAGKLEIAIRVDADGHLVGAEPQGASPPSPLVSVLRRTLPLLQAGTFAVRDGGGAGTEILELRARIDDDGGASSRLAFEYAGGRGRAGFTQASGRHVEVSVRVVRVEPAR